MQERNMGKQRVVPKVITAAELIKALQAGSITFAQAQQIYNGVIPIGDNNGMAAAFDINKQVIQPLVWAEQQHILGLLAGREEDYDLQTLVIPALEAVGLSHMAQIVVPTGEVWFINCIEILTPVGVSANWYCDLWTDRVGALGYGQSFHAVAIPASTDQWDEFSPPALIWLATNKQVPLRLPGGTKLTVVSTNTLAAVGAVNVTFGLFGWIGKLLVV